MVQNSTKVLKCSYLRQLILDCFVSAVQGALSLFPTPIYMTDRYLNPRRFIRKAVIHFSLFEELGTRRVAACIAKGNHFKIERLLNTEGMRNFATCALVYTAVY